MMRCRDVLGRRYHGTYGFSVVTLVGGIRPIRVVISKSVELLAKLRGCSLSESGLREGLDCWLQKV